MKHKNILALTAVLSTLIYNNINNSRRFNFQLKEDNKFLLFQLRYIINSTLNNNILNVNLSAFAQFLEEGSSWIGIYDLDVFKNVDNSGTNKYRKFKYIEKSGDQIIDSYNFDISDLKSGKKYIILLFVSNDYGRILDSYYFYKKNPNSIISEGTVDDPDFIIDNDKKKGLLYEYYPNLSELYYFQNLNQGIFWINKQIALGLNILPTDNIMIAGIKANNAQSFIKTVLNNTAKLSNLIPPIVQQLYQGNAFINFLRGTIFDGEYRLTDEKLEGKFVSKVTSNPKLYVEDKKFEKEWEKYKLKNGIDKYSANLLNRTQENQRLFPEEGYFTNNGEFDSNDKYLLIIIYSWGYREFRADQNIGFKIFDENLYKLSN